MKTILLVEDDPFLIDLYTTKLKEVGFETEIVEDGEQVLPKLKERKPVLVLLDIVLPNVDGWEILRKMKNNKELKNIPVLVLSNLGQKAEVEKGIKLGATKYLIKANYTPNEVVEEIKKLLRNMKEYEYTKIATKYEKSTNIRKK